VGIGDRAPHHARAHVERIGIEGLSRVDQRQALARQAAAAQDQFPPLLAAFPVAVVGGVVAEAEEDRQGQAHQRERIAP
jgi:hypothetical protein